MRKQLSERTDIDGVAETAFKGIDPELLERARDLAAAVNTSNPLALPVEKKTDAAQDPGAITAAS